MLCAHANESPAVCPCPPACYCHRTPDSCVRRGAVPGARAKQAPGGEPYSPEMLERCDPGIRDVVRLLNEAGFVTTDSGDGAEKEPGEGVLPYRHVVVEASKRLLIAEGDALYDFLREEGHGDGLHVESTYNPADGSAIVIASWP